MEKDDEWTKSKRLKAEKARHEKNFKSNNNGDNDSSEDGNVFDSDTEKPGMLETQVNESACKRVIGNDGNGFDSDAGNSNPDAQVVNGRARKRVIESSDEESD